jgi:protein-L-isoaspartate(D-aspartate) O-methyltransferase
VSGAGGSGKRFPLSLSSVAAKPSRAERGGPQAGQTGAAMPQARKANTPQTATPQTATRNAAFAAPAGSTGYVASGKAGGTRLSPWEPPQRASASPAIAQGMQHMSRMSSSGGAPVAQRPHSMNSDGVRAAMVERVARQGVRDTAVLTALATVPRHMFLEPGLASQAYIDASLPIGHHQTISQPYIVARMIEVLRDNKRGGMLERVLEIGTGCGYQAAVLSLVAKDVYSIERIKPLHELAKLNLRPLRIPNIRLHYGDGMLGFPQVAPFDGIILAAAGLEVPQALLEQLAVGGRLVAPVGGRSQVLQLIERTGRNEWQRHTLETCHFVPLRPGII